MSLNLTWAGACGHGQLQRVSLLVLSVICCLFNVDLPSLQLYQLRLLRTFMTKMFPVLQRCNVHSPYVTEWAHYECMFALLCQMPFLCVNEGTLSMCEAYTSKALHILFYIRQSISCVYIWLWCGAGSIWTNSVIGLLSLLKYCFSRLRECKL